MHKTIYRLIYFSAFLLLSFLLRNCGKQPDDDLYSNNQDFYNLTISPENPDSEDQILLIENTCGIEPEPLISYEGMQIIYKRYFNSLMGAPCRPTLDTTIIGPFNSGSYELVHWVIDKNHLLTDSVVSVDTLALIVR